MVNLDDATVFADNTAGVVINAATQLATPAATQLKPKALQLSQLPS